MYFEKYMLTALFIKKINLQVLLFLGDAAIEACVVMLLYCDTVVNSDMQYRFRTSSFFMIAQAIEPSSDAVKVLFRWYGLYDKDLWKNCSVQFCYHTFS